MPTPLELRPAAASRRRSWKHSKVRVNTDTARRVLAACEPEFLGGAHYIPVALTVDGVIVQGAPIFGTAARASADRAAKALLETHLGATGLVAQRGDTKLYLSRIGSPRTILSAYQGTLSA